MHKKKFYFIVFEGVEGTGKSYQLNKLYINLKKKKFNIVKKRKPGGCKTAENIRRLIFSKKANQFDSLTDYYLMCASRNEHIHKLLLRAKKEKKIIICDRFVDSTYAYQVVGKNINKQFNEINQNYILKGLKADLTIILKSSFTSIIDRIKKRKKNNKFDKLKIKFYKKAQNAYIDIAKKNKNYYIFDSSKNTPELEEKIFNLVSKKIKL